MVGEQVKIVPGKGLEVITPCPVCGNKAAKSYSGVSRTVTKECPRCGNFELTFEALHALERGAATGSAPLLSGWIRESNRNGNNPAYITVDALTQALEDRIPNAMRRAESILNYLAHTEPKLGAWIGFRNDGVLGSGYCADFEEVDFLVESMDKLGWISIVESPPPRLVINPSGHIRVDELQAHHGIGGNGFIAMWFNESMMGAFHMGFAEGIRAAGYVPVRVDQVEHHGKIDDEIIRQIRGSRFVVADFTGHRGGVYYEAGFAHGLGLPVFMTCRADHLKDLHFDIRQYNCIVWEDASSLVAALRNRIEAVLGHGPSN